MTTEEILIKLTADTDKATGEIKKLNKQFTNMDKGVKKTNTQMTSLSKGFTSAGTAVKGLVAGFAAMGIAVKAIDMAKMGADAEQSADAFEKVMTSMGKNAEEEFAKIKEASMGLIPNAAIRQSATTAVSLGVPLSKLAELMEVARAKSREMGTTVEKAFSDLATGIGRSSPMILDNLGLTIKLGEANENMAESLGKSVGELTKQEKTLALTNEVIKSGAESVKRFADAGLSANEQFQAMNAELDNLQVTIGQALLPHLVELSKSTTEWLNTLDTATVAEFTSAISGIFKGIIGIGKALLWINDVIMPDSIFGDDAGLLDTAAKGWAKIGGVIDNATKSTENFSKVKPFESLKDDSIMAIKAMEEVRERIVQLRELSINGITLNVDADTTPASFMVDKFVRTYDGDTVTIELTPEYLEAEQKIVEIQERASQTPINVPIEVDTTEAERDSKAAKDKIAKTPAKIKVEAETKSVPAAVQKMKDAIGKVPVNVKVDADTAKASAQIGKLKTAAKKPTTSVHTVDPNTQAVTRAITLLKQPTSSVHTINVKYNYPSGGGGPAGGSVPNSGARSMGSSGMGGMSSGGAAPAVQNAAASPSPGLGDLGTLTLRVGDNSFPALVPREVAAALKVWIDSEEGM